MSNTTMKLASLKEITAKPLTSITDDGIVNGTVLEVKNFDSARLIMEVTARTTGSIGIHSIEFSNDISFATGVKTFAKNSLAPNSIVDSSEYFVGDEAGNFLVKPFDQAVLQAVGKTSIQFEFGRLNAENYKYIRCNVIGSSTSVLTFTLRLLTTTKEAFCKIA